MRKRYILLKDTPEVKAGAIVEEKCDDGTQNYRVIEGKFQKEGIGYGFGENNRQIIYNRIFVEEQPEWFEELGILYFTSKQIKKIKKLLKSK